MPQDKDSSRKKLDRFLPMMWESVTEGVRDYYREYQHVAHTHRKCTKSDITRDHVVDRLRAAFHEDAEVNFRDANQTTYIDFIGEFQCLAKKADDDGKVEFSDTQASLEFQRNEVPSLFPDLPAVTNICLSYVPGDEPMNPSVYVICPGENGPIWAFEIEPPAASGTGTIREITPDLPPDDGAGDLIRIPSEKKADADDPESV